MEGFPKHDLSVSGPSKIILIKALIEYTKSQMQFENVTHSPIVTSKDMAKLIIEMIALPELHMQIGTKYIDPKVMRHLIPNIC